MITNNNIHNYHHTSNQEAPEKTTTRKEFHTDRQDLIFQYCASLLTQGEVVLACLQFLINYINYQ